MPEVFVDSDVVVSSLISNKGAAYLLLNKKSLKCIISNFSILELGIVADRLGIDKAALKRLIKNRLKQVNLKENAQNLKEKFKSYVSDQNDAHIVAGAKNAGVKFLISYNVKDFKTDRIKEDFDIIVTTPANFMQYLRSTQ